MLPRCHLCPENTAKSERAMPVIPAFERQRQEIPVFKMILRPLTAPWCLRMQLQNQATRLSKTKIHGEAMFRIPGFHTRATAWEIPMRATTWAPVSTEIGGLSHGSTQQKNMKGRKENIWKPSLGSLQHSSKGHRKSQSAGGFAFCFQYER